MFGHDNQDNQDNQQQQAGQQDDGQQFDQPQEQPVQQVTPTPATAEDTTSQSSFGASSAVLNTNPATDDLLDIKQEALQELTPLVGHLDQTPEEQFRTTMMMIQASDNHALVKVAYHAAKQITDEKERAQALLDIVNEINYFTQHAQA